MTDVQKFKTTFDVDSADDHSQFKIETIKRNTDMSKELNKFIKWYNKGEDLESHAKRIGITVAELIDRLVNMPKEKGEEGGSV